MKRALASILVLFALIGLSSIAPGQCQGCHELTEKEINILTAPEDRINQELQNISLKIENITSRAKDDKSDLKQMLESKKDPSTGVAATLPIVETRSANAIIQTAAILNGAVTSNGGAAIDERRFDWGTTSSCADGWTSSVSVSGSSFWYDLFGLTPGKTYYFRAWAHNSAGWSHGNVLSFTTPNQVCTPNSKRCNGNNVETCNSIGSGWTVTQSCGSGQTCSNGQCISSCTNECSGSGAKQCSGTGGYQTCGNYDSDSCLEWSSVTNCPSGQSCSNGVCSSTCTNECSASGAKQCSGTGGYQTCGNYDSDSCLEWSSVTNCPTGQSCSNGNCIPSGTIIKNLQVPYIHQCWDTANTFDGRWACGATSAVMVLASQGVISPWPIICNQPYSHTSSYGQYVSEKYTSSTGEVFGDASVEITNDAAGNPAKGAYGYIHYSDGLAKLDKMVSFFNKNGLQASSVVCPAYGGSKCPTEADVKAQIDAGYPVPVSTKLSGVGHWVVIKGYTSDGHYIVNDPFGSYPYAAGICGDYDGADVWYTWDQMKVNEKWMVIVSKIGAPTDKICVFRNGGLYFDKNGDSYWTTGDTTGWFGAAGDLPVAGDWNGDGKDEIAIFRNGGLYFDKNGDSYWTTGDTTGWFGAAGDLPVAGDWDGNGKDEIAIFRNGGWYFDKNGDGYWSTGDTTSWFGATGDLPVAGDWDGNGKDEIAIFRNGGLYFDKNGDGYWSTGDTTGWFGATGDLPAAGDWDGNGKDEIAVFRNGGWYFDKNGDGYWTTGDTTGWFGISGDKPVAGYWN